MAHFIDPRLWDDERFLALTDGARLLYLHLLCGPERRLPGLYRETVVNLAERLQRSFSETEQNMKVLERDEMAIVDRRAKVICVPAAPDYAVPPNNNQLKGWYMMWRELPNCEQKVPHVARLQRAVKLENKNVLAMWNGTFGRVVSGEITAASNCAGMTLGAQVVQLFDPEAKSRSRPKPDLVQPLPKPFQISVPNRDKIPD